MVPALNEDRAAQAGGTQRRLTLWSAAMRRDDRTVSQGTSTVFHYPPFDARNRRMLTVCISRQVYGAGSNIIARTIDPPRATEQQSEGAKMFRHDRGHKPLLFTANRG